MGGQECQCDICHGETETVEYHLILKPLPGYRSIPTRRLARVEKAAKYYGFKVVTHRERKENA